jgi:hypothetical protein
VLRLIKLWLKAPIEERDDGDRSSGPTSEFKPIAEVADVLL